MGNAEYMGTRLRFPERAHRAVVRRVLHVVSLLRREAESLLVQAVPNNGIMISPSDARKVGGNCRPKFALALVVALVCAVAEASRYKSYEPEPSYGGHYEEDDYGSDYHVPTEYEASLYESDGYGYGSSYEHKSYDHEPDYGSYEEDHDSYEKPYGHGGYDEESSYKTIGGGFKGSRYEQEYSKSKSYKQQPSYDGQDYKKSYRHKRAILPLVMPRRNLEEGIKMMEDMRATLTKLKEDTNTAAVTALNRQVQGASELFKRMLEAVQKKIE